MRAEVSRGAVAAEAAQAAVEDFGRRHGVGLVRRRGGADKGAMDWAAPIRLIADAALPPRCPACSAITREAHRFCADCWGSLRFLGEPCCAGCRAPFAFDRGAGARCGNCLAVPPRHRGIHAAVGYGPVARDVVLRLKYGRRIGHAETIARLMARVLPRDADLLVPVPLHRWRLWSRGFNQAALIADALARTTGVAVDRQALVRTRATGSMRGFGRRARARSARGAFAVVDSAAVAGKRLALVDDVHASGATADACTRALLKAGAVSVDVLVWARVLDGDPG